VHFLAHIIRLVLIEIKPSIVEELTVEFLVFLPAPVPTAGAVVTLDDDRSSVAMFNDAAVNRKVADLSASSRSLSTWRCSVSLRPAVFTTDDLLTNASGVDLSSAKLWLLHFTSSITAALKKLSKNTIIYVKFLYDVACQILWKATDNNVSQSYSRNKRGTVFLDNICVLAQAQVGN